MIHGIDDEIVSLQAAHSDIRRRYSQPESITPFLHAMRTKHASRCLFAPELRHQNRVHLSYPGYSEMLTGQVLPEIDSNSYGFNPLRTWLERERDQNSRSVVFSGNWGTFHRIYNAPASHISSAPVSRTCRVPRAQQFRTFPNHRHDIETYCAFAQAVRRKKPSAMHLALGMTDSWAHDGDYQQHLMHLELADQMVSDIATHMQPDYMVITTDHGRGRGIGWVGHGVRPLDAGCETSWCMLICRTAAHRRRAARAFSSMRHLKDVYRLLVALCG